jgi:hypothetical protein
LRGKPFALHLSLAASAASSIETLRRPVHQHSLGLKTIHHDLHSLDGCGRCLQIMPQLSDFGEH